VHFSRGSNGGTVLCKGKSFHIQTSASQRHERRESVQLPVVESLIVMNERTLLYSRLELCSV